MALSKPKGHFMVGLSEVEALDYQRFDSHEPYGSWSLMASRFEQKKVGVSHEELSNKKYF